MKDDPTGKGPRSNEPDEMITRGELCRAANVSKSTIRRWEEKGLLHPIIDEHGVRLFRVADVQALTGKKPVVHLPKARALVPSAATARGELAADVFERLDRGVEGADIVKELRVHPDVVSGFMARWEQLRGGVY
ncbi:MAG: MerR family transcriptional regulator [Labilithrix sp.]|nr:MerR family transcriptional regulator [Labilithrix sp.]